MAVKKERFGQMPDGREISRFRITNSHGLCLSLTDLGAVWTGMEVPDKNGVLADVVLGYDRGEDYLENGPHFGAVVGRVANRTAKGTFTLNGKTYSLAVNNGENNLHSGPDYYDRRLWNAKETEDGMGLSFSLFSPDGDQGFPGNLFLTVTYTLSEDDTVLLSYRAVSDADTPLSLTNHSYFNLRGQDAGSILDHEARILADFYTPSAADSIPTGEIAPVSGTPMDFRTFRRVGEAIDADFSQVIQGKGYDHNWCLSHGRGEYGLGAQIRCPESGRSMDVYTDCPGVQFYTANFLGGRKGKGGICHKDRDAFCFETQNFPDALHHPQFPSPVLQAGKPFVSRTGYRFYVEKNGAEDSKA